MTDYTACMFGASPDAFATLLERNTHTMKDTITLTVDFDAYGYAQDHGMNTQDVGRLELVEHVCEGLDAMAYMNARVQVNTPAPTLYVATWTEYHQSRAYSGVIGVFTDKDTAQRAADAQLAGMVNDGAYDDDVSTDVTDHVLT